MRRLFGLLSAAFLLGPTVSTASPILINGGFEQGPNLGSFQDVEYFGGYTGILGWTVTGQSIDYLGTPWDVPQGIHAIDLDGRNSVFGGIEQTFATTPGGAYLVSFDLSGNPGGGPLVKQMRVSVGGFSQDYLFDSTGLSIDALVWQSIMFSFMASGSTATLSFTSLSSTPNSYGALIDNVNVNPVPEPSSLLLLGSGLLVVAGGRFIRRRIPRRV